MGARPYAPQIGRFLSVDPIEGGACVNPYGYVNDPYSSKDLSGMKADCDKFKRELNSASKKFSSKLKEYGVDIHGMKDGRWVTGKGNRANHLRNLHDTQRRINNWLKKWNNGGCGDGGDGLEAAVYYSNLSLPKTTSEKHPLNRGIVTVVVNINLGWGSGISPMDILKPIGAGLAIAGTAVWVGGRTVGGMVLATP